MSVLDTPNQNTDTGSIRAVSWDEFKRMSRDFVKGAPTMNRDELENALKCVHLAFLSFEFPDTVIGNMQREIEGPFVMNRTITPAYVNRNHELKELERMAE